MCYFVSTDVSLLSFTLPARVPTSVLGRLFPVSSCLDITGSPKFTTTQGATKFTTTKGTTKSEKLSVKKAKIPGELRPLLG